MPDNELLIYDNIVRPGSFFESGISAKEVHAQLKGLDRKQPLTVRINSAGGDVFEAETMATHIAGWPGGVEVKVDGLAASAASYIAAHGQSVEMSEGAMMMIHAPWTVIEGNAEQLLERASLLEKKGEALARRYVKKTGQSLADIEAAMIAETWFSAEEAVEYGLADSISESEAMACKIPDIYAYKNAPLKSEEPEEPETRHEALQRQKELDAVLRHFVISA